MTAHALDHHRAGDCPNCGAAVSGNFCQQCGQEAVLHPPSIHEFLHEFVGHYVALEGKLWKTLKLLLLKPGQLTVEYMAGRRVRYIQPLRVYLTFSLIFFALVKFMGEEHHIGNFKLNSVPLVQLDAGGTRPKRDEIPHAPAGTTSPGTSATTPAKPVPARPSHPAGEDGDDDAAGVVDQVATDLAKDGITLGPSQGRAGKTGQAHIGFSEFIGKLVERATHGDTGKLKATFFGYAPYAIFALMPLFALYLKVLYVGSGRRYGEHLLFALHTNAFAFLMLAALLLVPNHVPTLGTVLFFWLMFYLPFAMRRVYGGSRVTTFVRWVVLMLLHLISVSVAVCLVLYVALTH